MINNIFYELMEFLSTGLVGKLPDILIYYGAFSLIKTNLGDYVLKRGSELKDVKKVLVPEEIKKKYDDVEINRITSLEFREIVSEFASFLLNNYPEEVLVNFYNNINEISVNKGLASLLHGAGAYYHYESNKIDILDFSAIYHELFHLASSYYDKENNIAYCGFCQITPDPYFSSNSKEIGRGLEEGYTELLTHRYFGEKHKMSWSYLFEVGVARRIEEIVGLEKMERLHLTSNLKGLLEELKKYSSEEEISDFLTSLDLLSNNDFMLLNEEDVKEKVVEVYSFVFKTAIMKIKKQFDDGNISFEEYHNMIDDYIVDFETSVGYNGEYYDIFPTDELTDFLEDVGFDIYNVFGIHEDSNRLVA